jgi:hypothetical protein
MVKAKGIKVSSDAEQIHSKSVPWLRILNGRPGYWQENENEKNLRIMFIRNPYTRLLSGFLDKGVLWGTVIKRGHREPYSATPAEFKRFIQALIARRDAGLEMNQHFELLSRLCGVSAGYQYNFYLKVEEIDVWYADFVSLLGIGHTTARGWKQHTTVGKAMLKVYETSHSITFFQPFRSLTGAQYRIVACLLRRMGMIASTRSVAKHVTRRPRSSATTMPTRNM